MSDLFQKDAFLHVAVGEEKQIPWDLAARLEGYTSTPTVDSATASLGTSETAADNSAVINTPTISGTQIIVQIDASEITTTGTWYLDVTATLSNGETPKARFILDADF